MIKLSLDSDSGSCRSPTFIRNIEFFTPDGYPGQVARCHFALAEYRDESFPEAGFALPDHLARAVPKRRAEYLAGRVLATLSHTCHTNPAIIRRQTLTP